MKHNSYSLTLIIFGLIFSSQSGWSASLGEPSQSEASAAIKLILEKNDDIHFIDRILRAHDGKKYSTSEVDSLISECEVFFPTCREDHVLLFRGEGRFNLPATSGLIRSQWNDFEYGAGLDLNGLIQKLNNDTVNFRHILGAPSPESPDKPDRWVLVPGMNERSVWYSETVPTNDDGAKITGAKPIREVFDSKSFSEPDPNLIPLTFRQLLFTFHANDVSFNFENSQNKKIYSLDPLISFSVNPYAALIFAVGNLIPTSLHTPGRLIVLSVPKNAFQTLCEKSETLDFSKILRTDECSDFLDYWDSEREVDVLGYVHPEWIHSSYLVDWESLSKFIRN